jgi:hypothetical protein
MLDLVARRRIDPDDVARVDAWIHARRLKHTDRPHPDSPLDAKFSLQYVIARALVDRHVGIADFEGDAYRDARVQALLPRVHVSPYDDTQFSPDNHFGGAVRVTLRDGTVETAVDGPDPRWGMLAPLSQSEVIELPGGPTYSSSVQRGATLTNSTDPLSLVQWTETNRINGRTYRSAFAAARLSLGSGVMRTFRSRSPSILGGESA